MNDLPTYQHEIKPLTPLQMQWLTTALDPGRIALLSKGRGPKMSYLEQWDVRRTLNRIFGFGGWSERIIESQTVLVERDIKKASGDGVVAFRITARTRTELYIHQLGTIYSGEAVSTQAGQVAGDVLDFAMKTSASDAFKRCAINLGTTFGLSLYDKVSRENGNYDVVGAAYILAVGQRPLDVAYAQMKQEIADTKMIEELNAYHSAKNPDAQQQAAQGVRQLKPGERPTDAPVQPDDVPDGVDVPIDPEQYQDSRAKVSGAFGG